MNQPLPTFSVASDVRRLIKQVESGNEFDIEFNAHAFDVQESVNEVLQKRLGRNDLQNDVEQRIEHFARSAASAQMYARLVVNDEMPDLPDYDPCHVSVYDGIQEVGTDFSKVIQRSTIYGTVMTSVNMTDLRAYFESGRKRHLLLYLGSDRNADMKALDKMLASLPVILAAAGMDAAAIKQVIAAIKAGNVPPALVKIIQVAMKLSDLKAMPSTPQIKTQIIQLQKEFAFVVTRAAPVLASIMPALAKMVIALKSFIADAPRIVTPQAALQVSTPERVAVRANNDNRMEPIKSAEVRTVKNEIMSVAVPVEKTPAFIRNVFPPLQTVLRQTLGIMITPVAKMAAPILDKIITSRPIAAMTPIQSVSPPKQAAPHTQTTLNAKMVQTKGTVSEIPLSVSTPVVTSDKKIQALPIVIEQPAPVIAIATAKTLETPKSLEIVRPAIGEAPHAEMAESKPIKVKPKEASTGPCGEFCRCAQKGEIVLRNEQGEAKTYTQAEVQKNADEHAKITRLIEEQKPADNPQWDEDLAKKFGHVCQPGCDHGAPKIEGVSSIATDIKVELKTIEPETRKNAPAWIGKRTVRPA